MKERGDSSKKIEPLTRSRQQDSRQELVDFTARPHSPAARDIFAELDRELHETQADLLVNVHDTDELHSEHWNRESVASLNPDPDLVIDRLQPRGVVSNTDMEDSQRSTRSVETDDHWSYEERSTVPLSSEPQDDVDGSTRMSDQQPAPTRAQLESRERISAQSNAYNQAIPSFLRDPHSTYATAYGSSSRRGTTGNSFSSDDNHQPRRPTHAHESHSIQSPSPQAPPHGFDFGLTSPHLPSPSHPLKGLALLAPDKQKQILQGGKVDQALLAAHQLEMKKEGRETTDTFLSAMLSPSQLHDPDTADAHGEGIFLFGNHAGTDSMSLTAIENAARGADTKSMGTATRLGMLAKHGEERRLETMRNAIKKTFNRKVILINNVHNERVRAIYTDGGMTPEEKTAEISRQEKVTKALIDKADRETGHNNIDKLVLPPPADPDPLSGTTLVNSHRLAASQPISVPPPRRPSVLRAVSKTLGKSIKWLLAVPDDPELESYSRQAPPALVMTPMGAMMVAPQPRVTAPLSVPVPVVSVSVPAPAYSDSAVKTAPLRSSSAPIPAPSTASTHWPEQQLGMGTRAPSRAMTVPPVTAPVEAAANRDGSGKYSTRWEQGRLLETPRGRAAVVSDATFWPRQSEVYVEE
ncbi:hypothetical protein BDV95DRAFT_389647 [Massariosphaeria phaeospora]|uniref:Uncharacterized protein n=1 Tax=Massariosphaeria phaeospora TaxID=100035 RepID=A0A7C8MB92_9PLEO|nr:hypothetical protein BDV95DRAFT_389647 [Massariosphaeria phaeospora]